MPTKLRNMKTALAGVAVLLMAGGLIWYWQTQIGDAGGKSNSDRTAPGKQAAGAGSKAQGMVDVAFDFLIVPEDKAVAILNERWNSDGDTALLTDLLKQAGSGAGGVIMAQRLTGSCRSGDSIKIDRTKPFPYGTEWRLNADGAVGLVDSYDQHIGSTAEVEVTVGEDGKTCDINLLLEHHFAEPELQRWPVSLITPDAPGAPSVSMPEFRRARTNSQVLMEMGQARMVSASLLPPPNGPAPGVSAGYLFSFISLPPIPSELDIAELPQSNVKEVFVRVVTFEKAGAATAMEAARPGDDERLFAALTASAAAGSAKITGDQTVVVRGGQRSKVEALREFPYPTEYDTDLSKALHLPGLFTFRNTGQTMEAEVNVGEAGAMGFPGQLVDINIAPEVIAMAFLHPWPVPDLRGAGQMGHVKQPVFASHQFSTQVFTVSGLNMLMAVAPAPQAILAEKPEPLYRYTFLRAGLNGENPGNPAAGRNHLSIQRRLHALTIRLPRDEAAALLTQPRGSDAALFDELSARVAAGTASLSSHTAIRCPNGYRSKVQSTAEFPSPHIHRDLIPNMWEFWNLHSSMEAEAEGQFSEDSQPVSGGWDFSLEFPGAPELIEYRADARRPALHLAAFEYVRRSFSAHMTIPPSGVLCAGVMSSSPATDDERAPDGSSDICFLFQSPPPDKTEAELRPQVFLHTLLLSVPATEGPALAGSGKPATTSGKAAMLLDRLASGEIHCAAHAAVTFSGGGRSRSVCERLVPQPGEFVASESSPGLKIPTYWESEYCGVTFVAEYSGAGDDITVNAVVAWDIAPVLPFGEPGAEIPDMKARRCTERIELKDLTLPPDKPVIADVRPSKAREGTPEHGRWHVLILKATP